MLEPSVFREAPAQVQGESCGFLGVGGDERRASWGRRQQEGVSARAPRFPRFGERRT